MKSGVCFVMLAAGAGLVSQAQAQPVVIERPQVMAPLRPYMAPTVSPIRMTNSPRLYTLIRAGNLYLTVADALALAIENNLNLEIDRYGPLLAQSALERAQGGGATRGVPSSSSQVSSVNSGVGVNGTTSSAGLSSSSGSSSSSSGGNATVQQVGAVTPNLDPFVQSTTSFSHLSQPQSNVVVSQTSTLIQSVRTYNTVLQQGLLTGGLVQFRDYEQYLKENSPSDALNPAMGPHMDLLIRQNFLRGFGIKLNDRSIRIAKINTIAARDVFRSQLLDLTVSVLNLYWDLVSARDELKLRQHALGITEKFLADTKYEISVGAIAGVDLPRAEAEVASRRQDVVVAQATVRQRATLLKEALSHTEDPALEAAEIVPLDSIELAETEELPPLRQLVTSALANRPDVAVAKLRDETEAINLIGTTSPLLPSLQVTLQTYNRGVAGTRQASGGEANSYFVGGYGTALGQIFRRDFPNTVLNVQASIDFNNRPAQGDYGIDQLQYRQSQLSRQRDRNQILVDISSQINALRQARTRHSTARNTRILQEELLEAERKKSYGTVTFNYIMTDQRALIAAQLSELNAAAAYARARVALDQVLGTTLERHHISLDDALNGRVQGASKLPETSGPPKN